MGTWWYRCVNTRGSVGLMVLFVFCLPLSPLSLLIVSLSSFLSRPCYPQEPRHLQFIAEFSDSDVYTLLSARKNHGAPTDYGFCVKVFCHVCLSGWPSKTGPV